MARFFLPAWLPPLPGQPLTPPRPALSRPRPLTPLVATTASRPRRPREQMIEVSLSDRWYILGQTGSGKTLFAKRLIRELLSLFPLTNLYVLDSKGDQFPGWPGMVPSQEPPAPLVGARRIQVWQPPDDDTADYDTWLDGIKRADGPAILLIDELSSLGRGTFNSYPPALARLLKQGRSLQKCVVTLTQESAGNPRQVAKQTTHVVGFSLNPTDEHAVAELCRLCGWPIPSKGEPAPRPAHQYGFFYRRIQPAPGAVAEYHNYQQFFDKGA